MCLLFSLSLPLCVRVRMGVRAYVVCVGMRVYTYASVLMSICKIWIIYFLSAGLSWLKAQKMDSALDLQRKGLYWQSAG